MEAKQGEEKEEEKEEKADEEEKEDDKEDKVEELQISLVADDVSIPKQVAIKTLVSLPHLSPLASPTKTRMQNLPYMLRTNSQGGFKEMIEDVDLNEVITIPKFDLETLTLEKIQILQEAFKKKKRQEKLKKEHTKRQVLYDKKDIFLDAFDIKYVQEDKSIVEQLVHTVDKVNTEDIETNMKLME